MGYNSTLDPVYEVELITPEQLEEITTRLHKEAEEQLDDGDFISLMKKKYGT